MDYKYNTIFCERKNTEFRIQKIFVLMNISEELWMRNLKNGNGN